MSSLYSLLNACQAEQETVATETRKRLVLWDKWLQPISDASAVGGEPDYNDDFEKIREEVDKLSGADAMLICELAEKLLVNTVKDIRIVTWYCWAKLHSEGESGLADGLELLAGLIERFGTQLYPQRDRSRKAALEWLAGSRLLNSLTLFPQVVKTDARRTAGALLLLSEATDAYPSEMRPELGALYSALEFRLMSAGGMDAVVPQVTADKEPTASHATSIPVISDIKSGSALLEQGRILARYLREQPGGWLAAHHLMKSLRHDTILVLPALEASGCTCIEPPKADRRALLKRLYLQQNWTELLDNADSMLSRGSNQVWMDLMWYTHQALLKSGQQVLAEIVVADLKGLLIRLPGLEALAFKDGTPFADEVTLSWIQQEVMSHAGGWGGDVVSGAANLADNDILQLESEALALADSSSVEKALDWLQNRPGVLTARQKWLLRLLMARVAEQYGKNELAIYLLDELNSQAGGLTLAQWEPVLLFEVRARHLKLLRMKAGRSETDKQQLNGQMDTLLSGLIQLDPARAAILCG
nr:type VI secretion system protein TssA [uncultured Enterobacter sp.]